MDLPEWLKEQRELNFNVRSWIDLANRDDTAEIDTTDDKKDLLDGFVIEEKKDYSYSKFKDEITTKRRQEINRKKDVENNIWSDNVPDLDDEDPYYGSRIHCWVMIKSNKRGLPKDIFIEPSTGTEFSLSDNP